MQTPPSSDTKRQLLAERLRARAVIERPLSPTQRRLWFFERLEPGTSVLHISFRLHLPAAVETALLERALARFAERHETLRTAIRERDGGACQVIMPVGAVPLTVSDVRTLEPAARDVEVARLEAVFTARPFDFAQGPLWRALLIQLTDTRQLLVVTMHHLISDGQSVTILLRDLPELYTAEAEGRVAELPVLPIQYGEYAERLLAEPAREEQQLAYWRSQLAGSLPVLELPTDFARPESPTFSSESVEVTLPADVLARVQEFSRAHGLTPFMTLLAGFKVWLSRLTGVTDVIVGTPVAGRTSADVENLVGVFINTLALRTQLDDAPSFVEVCRRVKAVAIGALAHQELPFDALVADLKVERSRARTPVFQVMFNMIEISRTREGAELIDLLDETTKFDLTSYARRRVDTIVLTATYRMDLFSRARMSAALSQYVHVLDQVLADPARRVTDLDLSPPAERAVLPDPAVAFAQLPDLPSAGARLREHATANPARPALTDSSGSWTFQDLDQRSDAVAAELRQAGVGPGSIVAVYAHRSAALVSALLGIRRAGAAFAILDPALVPAKLAASVAAVSPAALIRLTAAGSVPDVVERALATSCRCTLELPPTGLAGPARPSDVAADPDALVYVAFTSGTTGGAKAIAGTERPLSHFLAWHERTFGLTRTDRFSMLSGLAHDPVLRDILTPVWLGATLVVPEPARLRVPADLAAWFQEQDITVAHLTPQHARVLVDGCDETGIRLPRLRRVFFAGDVLSPAVVDAVRRVAPVAECVNFYGTTETPQAMAFSVIASAPATGVSSDSLPPAALPLGRGIDTVDVLVMSSPSRLAGIGEPGEIWIRTPYLSSGYLNDPVLTAERFVRNPFTNDPADRVYRTGDLGRYRPDGQVEFIGRGDSQVKVRGFRVELQEVEDALAEHPAVAAAAVVTRRDERGDVTLSACVVPRPGMTLPPSEDLRQFVSARVPEYAVPGRFEQLERLPLTPNGKLDRSALAATRGIERRARAMVPPRTETEVQLVDIWRDLLGAAAISTEDSFFELGGHSLLATQVISRIRARIGVELPLRVLFERPTVAELAEAIDRVRQPTRVAAVAGEPREEFEF